MPLFIPFLRSLSLPGLPPHSDSARTLLPNPVHIRRGTLCHLAVEHGPPAKTSPKPLPPAGTPTNRVAFYLHFLVLKFGYHSELGIDPVGHPSRDFKRQGRPISQLLIKFINYHLAGQLYTARGNIIEI